MIRNRAGALVLIALLAAAALAGCSRLDRFASHLRSIQDPDAYDTINECLWAHGSFYYWVSHRSLRCRVARSEYYITAVPEVGHEIWLLDLERNRFRVERPAEEVVEVFDGVTWRVFRGGVLQQDPSALARAAADAHLARELLTLPFSLFEPHRCQIIYAGPETNPGGGRAWHRLAVRYPPSTDHLPRDRMLIYIRSETDGVVRKRTDMIDKVVLHWSEAPFNGQPFLVEFGLYEQVGEIKFPARWDFYPAEAADNLPGRYVRKGPLRQQFRLTGITFDVPLKDEMFQKP